MQNKKQLKKYAKQFIFRLKPSIRSGYSISALIYPSNGKGAILEFIIDDAKKSKIELRPTSSTINKSLNGIEQRLIGGNIESVSFSGTNVYMDGNKILLIKGDDNYESWNNSAVEDDIERIISPESRS